MENEIRNTEAKSECPSCNPFSSKYDRLCPAHQALVGVTVGEVKAQIAEPNS